MHIKLYGRPLSTATRRAALVLVEKGVPFELVSVDTLKKEQKAPAYLERHPFGQIPLLVTLSVEYFLERKLNESPG